MGCAWPPRSISRSKHGFHYLISLGTIRDHDDQAVGDERCRCFKSCAGSAVRPRASSLDVIPGANAPAEGELPRGGTFQQIILRFDTAAIHAVPQTPERREQGMTWSEVGQEEIPGFTASMLTNLANGAADAGFPRVMALPQWLGSSGLRDFRSRCVRADRRFRASWARANLLSDVITLMARGASAERGSLAGGVERLGRAGRRDPE